jgi:NAD(P)H-hydrate epimerase
VLDADALNLMAADTGKYFALLRERMQNGQPPAILTPHPGEFRRLLPGVSLTDRQAAARLLAAASGSIAVLKGASTVIAQPDGSAWINPTGHKAWPAGAAVMCWPD